MSSIQLTGSEQGESIVPAKVAGDKGNRSQWIDEWLLGQHITPVIPSKKNEDRACRAVEFDKASYRRRCIIEQMIGWIGKRRVFQRKPGLASKKMYGGYVALRNRGLQIRILPGVLVSSCELGATRWFVE
jgi:hypothetical protein